MDTEEEVPSRAPQQGAITSAGADRSEDPATADQAATQDERPIATATDVALEQDA
jgi:hypothetical protein